jgi:hypothetical protein
MYLFKLLVTYSFTSTIDSVLNGILPVTDLMLPYHLYEPGTRYNAKKVRNGLFRGPSWIYVCCL